MKAFAMHSTDIAPDSPAYLPGGLDGRPAQILAVMPGYEKISAADIQDDVILLPEKLPPIPTRRLVVLVPPGKIDENALARRVWQLAASSGFQVLFLALGIGGDQAATQRRRIADLASVTADKEVRAQASVSDEQSWPEALEKVLRPGDLLICLSGHQVSVSFFRRKPLGERLAASTGGPVYLLGGLKIGPTPHLQAQVKEILAWTASLALLAAFFGLQVGIDRSTTKSAATILLSLSVVAELYLLWKINEWIG